MIDLTILLERCRQGDELAWEALVRGFEGRVYGMALHYLRDADEARDVAQEAFVRVWRSLGSESDDAAFVPWLLRVTRNAAIDRLRRRRARHEVTEDPSLDPTTLASVDASPEEAFLASARERLVYRALGRISDANREILLLKDIEGLDLLQISDLLSIPLGTAKSRAHRARLELARSVIDLDPSYGA